MVQISILLIILAINLTPFAFGIEDAEGVGPSPMIVFHVTTPDGGKEGFVLEKDLLADEDYLNEKELLYAKYLIKLNCAWPEDVFDQIRNLSIITKDQQDIVIQTLQNAQDKCIRYQTIAMNQIPPDLREITDFEAKCLVKILDFALENENQPIENRKFISPKMQIFCEVPPDMVRCNVSLQLIFKSTDGSPACVKPETAEKLIERGWATNSE